MSNQFNGVWTAERTDRLRELYAEGYSSQLIADAIGAGLSRSSVMGKIGRLGLARTRAVVGKDGRATLGPTHVKSHTAAPPIVKEADPIGVSLIDLQPGQCRFPYGDDPPYSFCGCPSLDGMSYCEPHHRLTHTEARGPTGDYRQRSFRPAMVRAA